MYRNYQNQQNSSIQKPEKKLTFLTEKNQIV